MAFIRYCFIIAVTMLFVLCTNAQTVSYPLKSSQLLKSTAEDVAMLLQKAVAGSQFTTGVYSVMPQTGVIFIYDSTITNNQLCRVESDGINFIKFSASQDNGLCFGIYQYLNQSGFRFYQPGTVWEIIPTLLSAYKKTDSTYSTNFKYNSWFVSGGHRKWIMDNNNSYSWDTYSGENGHSWALYQRRNAMTGQYRFAGHRSDIITSSLSTWQNNPCYVACNNNSRVANAQSVPDVNKIAAMQLWSATIQQKYEAYKNIIYGNTNLYVNQYRNFNYNSFNFGIEVPDGAKWGNTKDNLGCINEQYAKESDQNFILANYTAQKIGNQYPNLRFQLYAYSAHADIPSANIPVNEKLDVQLIPAVYQNISSTNGLRNRWYNLTKNISEYNYLNLSGWSGETPAFYLDDLKATVQIAKDKKSQGLVWESSPAKFASLPYLLAANKSLLNNTAIDNTLQEFCDNMFTAAGKTINNLLHLWTDDKVFAGGNSTIHKFPLYLQLITEAEQKIKNEPDAVKERLRELKAYLHYMIMYFDWAGYQGSSTARKEKAANLCIYLAKVNKLQLVNSYYMIAILTGAYAADSNFVKQYNNISGLAYQNGNLPLITTAEIESNFQKDKVIYGNLVTGYAIESAAFIKDEYNKASLISPEKITFQLRYTNGLDYYNRSEFFIKAPAAGSFTINYTPYFGMPDKGYVNFTVESTDKALEIIKDFSIDRNAQAGALTIVLPQAGTYKLSVYSKFKTTVDINIRPNKNIFYKRNSFLGSVTEYYANNNLSSLPGYFYVPKGIGKIYFSIGNSYTVSSNSFASAQKINNALAIKDNKGIAVKARFVTPNDSSLFYFDVPADNSGSFYKITQKGSYDVTFSNISNLMWYAVAKLKPCTEADFTVSVVNKNGSCKIQLTASSKSGPLDWEVNDLGKMYNYSNQAVIYLPEYISPKAVVTLANGSNCSVTKKIGDDAKFLKAYEACASGAPLPETGLNPVLYPNPSSGVFKFLQNRTELTVNEITILNAQGLTVGKFKDVNQFNLSKAAAGPYWYKIIVKGIEFTGKLIKL